MAVGISYCHVVPSFWKEGLGVAKREEGAMRGAQRRGKRKIRFDIFIIHTIGSDIICSATTLDPSSLEEGTTVGALHTYLCYANPTIVLFSSFPTFHHNPFSHASGSLLPFAQSIAFVCTEHCSRVTISMPLLCWSNEVEK